MRSGMVATLMTLMLLLAVMGVAALAQEPAGMAAAVPAAGAVAQSQPAAPAPRGSSSGAEADTDDPVTTIRVPVNEVNVIFTATDRRGRFVKDLTVDDIRVLDDEKPPQAIVNFVSQTDLPLRVGLVLDASNSIRDRFLFEQEAAAEFLNTVIRPRYDQAFVLGFDTTPEITQDFTDDAQALTEGLRMLRPGGGTALFDALFYACRDKLLKLKEGGPVRKAIILISDGDDNQSRVSREEAIEMAQRAEVIVYTISTNISGNKTRGDKVLERIAEATGGRSFFPFKMKDVANALAEIQDELRSQYALAYRPADFEADGRFRSIEIIPENDKKKVRIRARKGYYAPRSN